VQAFVVETILRTKHEGTGYDSWFDNDDDAWILPDLDLMGFSNLLSPGAAFRIREEFSHVPDKAFWEGRRQFLLSFAQKEKFLHHPTLSSENDAVRIGVIENLKSTEAVLRILEG